MAFKSHPARAQTPVNATRFHEWVSSDGSTWLTFYREPGGGYLLRFPGLADFIVSSSGDNIEAFPATDTSRVTIDHLYLNQVLPLALSRQLKLMLHASAVEAGKGAIMFVGKSGQGKSTLAASFATNGYRFLSDDGLEIEQSHDGYIVKPGHASIRLWDDSRQALSLVNTPQAPAVNYTHKARLLANDAVAHCNQPLKLNSIFFLENDSVNKINISPLKGGMAVKSLVQNSFLLDIEQDDMLRKHFESLADLARQVKFYTLAFPRKYGVLADVRKAVLDCSNKGNAHD